MPLIRLANRFSSVIGLRHVTVVTYRRAGDDDSMERAGCFLACRLVDPFNSFSRRSRKPKVLFLNEFKSLLYFGGELSSLKRTRNWRTWWRQRVKRRAERLFRALWPSTTPSRISRSTPSESSDGRHEALRPLLSAYHQVVRFKKKIDRITRALSSACGCWIPVIWREWQ